MSGGGTPNQATSTTSTHLPAWEQPYAKDFLSSVFGQIFPGQSLPTSMGGTGANGSPLSPAAMPAGLNQNVAPFTPFQNQAFQMGSNVTGPAQGLADIGAGTIGNYASGGMLGPNPYLNQYYNQAAQQDVMNYSLGTQPSLMAEFQRAGALDSSGFNQAQGLAQYGLGQSLATLGANTYEPAYQFESGQALNAAQSTPNAVAGLYGPTQQLYGLGSAQQQQQQNVNTAATANAQQAANWPFNLLSQLGGALGQASGGGGTTVSTGPSMSGGK